LRQVTVKVNLHASVARFGLMWISN
jgi:hypothetical protein